MNKDNNSAKLRTIRSFVRRAGRVTTRQKLALDTLWTRYGIEPAVGVMDFAHIFQRQVGTALEIGFGNGQTLLSMAAALPDTNFIGIEVHRPGVGALLAGIEEQQLTNVRVFQADALEVLNHTIPDHSLSAVYLFFPDPWHKKRHHKRRIVQADFVRLLHRKLHVGGVFHMATDWQEYAEHMLATMESDPNFTNQAGVGHYSTKPEYRPTTKFEQRGERLGHGVWDLIYTVK
ncbi:MAG: tRNA (guanosine(46)-N7)-methyltransferase TrmB [Gammaproteobacteria bacterium]|nr:tRNA (guanosine(46)-N7)-methyltransferase TrmB [Gammaproteobacteria bacterium]